MRIFEIQWAVQDEKEWVSGNTIIEALKTYLSITGADMEDFDNKDKIIELPESLWDKYTVINADSEITFTEWIKQNLEPGIIAGTCY